MKRKIFNPDRDAMTKEEMKIFFEVKNQKPKEEKGRIIVPVSRPPISARVTICVEHQGHEDSVPITTPN